MKTSYEKQWLSAADWSSTYWITIESPFERHQNHLAVTGWLMTLWHFPVFPLHLFNCLTERYLLHGTKMMTIWKNCWYRSQFPTWCVPLVRYPLKSLLMMSYMVLRTGKKLHLHHHMAATLGTIVHSFKNRLYFPVSVNFWMLLSKVESWFPDGVMP